MQNYSFCTSIICMSKKITCGWVGDVIVILFSRLSFNAAFRLGRYKLPFISPFQGRLPFKCWSEVIPGKEARDNSTFQTANC